MKNKKVLIILAVLLFIVGISTCFAVAIFGFDDEEKDFVKLDVRIERAGICNPLKPVEEKSLDISEKEEKKLQKYWEDTDKSKAPGANEMCDCVIGDYKLFVGEDEILYNLDLGYVLYDGSFVDISDEFHRYLAKVTEENDIKAEEDGEKNDPPKIVTDPNSSECCSCCPDSEPGDICIDACCECIY